MYQIYFLVNETMTDTYVGFTNDFEERKKEHRAGKVKSTRRFGNFIHRIIEEVATMEEARNRERYWKSCAGRKKLKKIFEDMK